MGFFTIVSLVKKHHKTIFLFSVAVGNDYNVVVFLLAKELNFETLKMNNHLTEIKGQGNIADIFSKSI